MDRHLPLLATTLLLGVAAMIAFAAGLLPGPTPIGEASIVRADLERHVEFLASDEMAGRDTGHPEIAVAESYVADRFRQAGLSPCRAAARSV